MRKSENKSTFAIYSLHILGFLFCIIPPAVCTVLYFPLWREAGGGRSVCGLCAFFLVLSALPLYKALGRYLRSAASYTVWIVVFLFCFLFSRIAEEATVISFVGAVGNVIGAMCFKIAGRHKRTGEKENE